MKRKLLLILLILSISNIPLAAQELGGYVRTSAVLQLWNIEDLKDGIFEATLPVEVYFPVRENVQLQINHSPAISQFGEINLSGLSDTWLKASYLFADGNGVASLSLGLPTGRTKLDSLQVKLAKLLSWQSFQFALPVFGQGFTVSAGAMYAYPFSEKLNFGIGANLVYRAKYNFTQDLAASIDPGEQIGLNIGTDYLILDDLQASFDFVFNYFTPDKFDNVDIFASGPQFSLILGLQYQRADQFYWLRAYYQGKAKNQIYDYLNEKLIPEPKNSNITIRQLNAGFQFNASDKISLSVIAEVRSYVENELKHGWTDLGGGGLVGQYHFSDRLNLFSSIKIYYGDGEIFQRNPVYQGYEFMLGTEWQF